jgi:polysaccharide export outer membrane protein
MNEGYLTILSSRCFMARIGIREVYLLLIVLFGVQVLLAGCSGVKPATTSTQMAAEPESRLVFAPGDAVEVKFFYTPDLNSNQIVRPDGTISLQLIGDVQAAGKTPLEFQNELIRLYSPQLKKPDITVVAGNLKSRHIAVNGEVFRPGAFDMTTRMTVLDAIGQAGGFKDTAAIGNVMVLRYKNNRYVGCALNMKNAFAGKEVEPFWLEPNDIVYVPKTGIAKVNQWVDQHINKMIPKPPIGVGFSP